MKRRMTALLLICALLLSVACASGNRVELAPYSLQPVSKMANQLDLRLENDNIYIGGDDALGSEFINSTGSLTVHSLKEGEIIDITIGPGGAKYSLFGISLGMPVNKAMDALHAYCDANDIRIGYGELQSVDYMEFDESLYVEFDCDSNDPYYGMLSVTVDNGVVTEIMQYYL